MPGFQIMQDQGSQSSPYKSKDAEITQKIAFCDAHIHSKNRLLCGDQGSGYANGSFTIA